MNADSLPSKLSDLIEVSLADLESVERDSRYVVNMGNWHYYYSQTSKCNVCLAGCVIAKSLKSDRKDTLHPITLGLEISNKLTALDFVRSGFVTYALDKIDRIRSSELEYLDVPFYAPDRHFEEYEDDEEIFKDYLITLIGVLRAEGL